MRHNGVTRARIEHEIETGVEMLCVNTLRLVI